MAECERLGFNTLQICCFSQCHEKGRGNINKLPVQISLLSRAEFEKHIVGVFCTTGVLLAEMIFSIIVRQNNVLAWALCKAGAWLSGWIRMHQSDSETRIKWRTKIYQKIQAPMISRTIRPVRSECCIRCRCIIFRQGRLLKWFFGLLVRSNGHINLRTRTSKIRRLIVPVQRIIILWCKYKFRIRTEK